MNKVLLSLGSNLSSRKLNIKSCVEFLNNAKKIDVIGVSSLYESSPMYNFEQDNFINCVIEIKTPLKPLELIRKTRSIEVKMGRQVGLGANQPRKIDIDILTYNREIIIEKNLNIPHPGIKERKFVLIPLFELKGNISIPGHCEKIEDLIEDLDKNSDKIRKCNYSINEKNLSYSS
ncbi:MAG: 2-amino-4-hydroxy-6-hydroxymethyldihydropteridine diphosphokinase [Candidatus Marinimicrobia bacterium]|nr:2-amino-4-hydroxy-6-hydroxymethyldihydropteridine diphosphokinase [Candidatus Neomarinimicrobiota bacterium]|tara:strand:+ start:1780 stop:2307 length:528 start_codon:yes stop_codon:yes gene_type:complete